MTDPTDPAPDLAAFLEMAEAAFAVLPEPFRAQCRDVVIRVAELAEPVVLEDLGIQDPLDLTGLFKGVALTERSHLDPVQMPNEVWLYRQPILAEWRERGDVAIDRLVTHVLVHEIAHHFGMSDADIARIDRWWV